MSIDFSSPKFSVGDKVMDTTTSNVGRVTAIDVGISRHDDKATIKTSEGDVECHIKNLSLIK